MNKTLIKGMFSFIYVLFLLFTPWNFFTFYIAVLGAWFVLLSWLPFNSKKYQTANTVKIFLLGGQALLLLIFSWGCWQLLGISFKEIKGEQPSLSYAGPQQIPAKEKMDESQEAEKLFPAETSAVSNAALPYSAQQPPSSLNPNISADVQDKSIPFAQSYPGVPREDFSRETVNIQKKSAPETPAEAAIKAELDSLRQHPGYIQAARIIQEQILKLDEADTAKILSTQEQELIKKQVPFMRHSVASLFIQKRLKKIENQIGSAHLNNLSPETIEQLRLELANTTAIFNKIRQRHTQKYQLEALKKQLDNSEQL